MGLLTKCALSKVWAGKLFCQSKVGILGYPWVSHMSQVRITDLHRFSPWTFTGNKLDIVPFTIGHLGLQLEFQEIQKNSGSWTLWSHWGWWAKELHIAVQTSHAKGRKWNEPKIRVLRAGDKNWCKTPRKLIVEGRLRNHMLGHVTLRSQILLFWNPVKFLEDKCQIKWPSWGKPFE